MNGACSETVCFGESCSGHGICQAVSYDDIVRDEDGDVVAKYKNCLCEKEYRKLKNGKTKYHRVPYAKYQASFNLFQE